MTHTIGIDLRMWGHPGIGRYARELSQGLLRLDAQEDFTFICSASDKPALEASFSKKKAHLIASTAPIYSLSEQWQIPRLANGFRLLHVPHFNIPVFFKGRLVVTVHDLTYLKERGVSKKPFAKAYAEYLFKAIAEKASVILTVSEYTKKDLLNSFSSLKPEKIVVTHEAASPIFRKIENQQALQSVRQKHGLQKPFVLFVGTLKPHKNVETLLRAMAKLHKEKKIKHELVLVGKKDPAHLSLWQEISACSFVRYLGEVDDQTLAILYNLTEAFILPSLREGFGLPVVEAMASGAPVIVSDRSSLPEVAAEAGLVFDPRSIDALSGLIYNVLTDKELQDKMSRKSLERAKFFSWEDTAKRTLQVYRQVLGG